MVWVQAGDRGYEHHTRVGGHCVEPRHGATSGALVLEVDGQVEEVVGAPEVLVDRRQQHLLRVLVGDVPNHQRRASVIACHDRKASLSPLHRGNVSSRSRVVDQHQARIRRQVRPAQHKQMPLHKSGFTSPRWSLSA